MRITVSSKVLKKWETKIWWLASQKISSLSECRGWNWDSSTPHQPPACVSCTHTHPRTPLNALASGPLLTVMLSFPASLLYFPRLISSLHTVTPIEFLFSNYSIEDPLTNYPKITWTFVCSPITMSRMEYHLAILGPVLTHEARGTCGHVNRE